LCSCYAKIFTKDIDDKIWLNSGLEGYLCIIWDRTIRFPIFRMFNPINYDLLFELELFWNFYESYVPYTFTFHYFYAPGGFIGFSFSDKK